MTLTDVETHQIIDLSGFADGVYYVKAQADDVLIVGEVVKFE